MPAGQTSRLCPRQILVAPGVRLVGAPQMAARHAEGAAHVEGDVLRVVHQLHVEGVGAHIDDRVGVQRLRPPLVRLAEVDVVVVDGGSWPDEASQGPGHGESSSRRTKEPAG